MSEGITRLDQELIKQYREYDEDRDQGRHRFANLIIELSRRAGSQSLVKIEEWVAEQETKYGLSSLSNSPKTGTDTNNHVASLEGRRYIEQVIAETTDSEKKGFFEKLLYSRK